MSEPESVDLPYFRYVLILFALAGLAWLLFGPLQSFVSANLQIAETVSSSVSSLEDGLVAHWTFDGDDINWADTSTEVKDVSGYSNDGNARGDIAQNSTTLGVLGQAMNFNGTTDYVQIADDTELGITDAMAISAWVKLDDNTPNTKQFIVSKRSGTTATANYRLLVDDGSTYDKGELYFSYYAASNWRHIRSNYLIPDTEWHNLTAVFDYANSEVVFYDNGVEVASPSITQNIVDYSGTDVHIGTDSSKTDFLAGDLDDVRIYNRTLTADEVKRLYKMGEGVKVATTPSEGTLTTGLVGHWTFDGNDIDWGDTSTEIKDSSGNGNDGNAQGSVGVDSPVIGPVGQALNMDKLASDYIDLVDNPLDFDDSDDLTISAWVRSTNVTSDQNIISDLISFAGSSPGYDMYFERSGSTYRPRCAYQDGTAGGSDEYVVNGTYTTAVDTWRHIVCVWDQDDADNTLLYINGEVDVASRSGTITAVGSLSNSYATRIGSRSGPTPGVYLDGDIDDVRIYNRALTADEVQQLYSMGEGTKISTTVKSANSPLETGLVGHWTFDGPDVRWQDTSSEIKDATANANDGNATTTMSPGASPVRGLFGQALTFDGAYDYIEFADDDIFSFTDGAGTDKPFSISAWIKPDGGANQSIITKFSPSSEWAFAISSSRLSMFLCHAPSCLTRIGRQDFSGMSPYTGEWTHVMATYSGSETSAGVKLYINGQRVDDTDLTSGSYTGMSNTASVVTLAGPPSAGLFSGEIDDVRVYDRELSATEVGMLYQVAQ
ncbi:LamG domain-containing protein [Candidatus Nomurabacteria bacterium]|nr:LamG domain-containing protein [Candidatus Nomurabacteria bacterium]